MTDMYAELEAALDRVMTAARAHLDAVKAAEGAVDDDAVWHAYVALNNASHDYDEALHDVFGEVTPWDLELLSPEEAQGGRAGGGFADLDEYRGMPDDPYGPVVSVRQRRDYRVPSVSALVAQAEQGRAPAAEGETLEPISTVADAILALLQAGDGSLRMLDLDELEPLDGVVIVAEVAAELNSASGPVGDQAFLLGAADRLVGHFNEQALGPGD